jgi:hypothetical protein
MHISVWRYIINLVYLTCSHSCGQPQGGMLQRVEHQYITEVCEPVYRCKVPSVKNRWF